MQALRADEAPYYDRAVGDYLLLLLLTGLRQGEGLGLRWDQVDLEARTLSVSETQEPRAPAAAPVGFPGRAAAPAPRAGRGRVALPGAGESGRLIESRPQMRRITQASGVEFTLHDLRRTFITVAESLDIPYYAIKRLVNHKMMSDVAAGYIVTNIDRLREPVQRITDYMLKIRVSEN